MSDAEIAFGDSVRIRVTPLTESLGYAGRTGVCYGFTTLKGTKNSDHARDLPFHESVLVQHSGGEAVSMFPARSASDIR